MPGYLRFAVCAIALAGCASSIAAESPSSMRRGDALVFGRVRVIGVNGDVDWSSFNLLRTRFDLFVQPAGSREAVKYTLEGDGSFAWALPPGEHRIVGFVWGDVHGPTRTLLRVVPGERVVYAGTLVIRFAGGRYRFGVEDDETAARRALFARWPDLDTGVARSLFRPEVEP